MCSSDLDDNDDEQPGTNTALTGTYQTANSRKSNATTTVVSFYVKPPSPGRKQQQ